MIESFPYRRHLCDPLYRRLRTIPTPWSDIHTDIFSQINQKVRSYPCLGIPHLATFMVTETDASDIGYAGILKEQLVHYHSNIWLDPQQHISTTKILVIVIYISKFKIILLPNNFCFV